MTRSPSAPPLAGSRDVHPNQSGLGWRAAVVLVAVAVVPNLQILRIGFLHDDLFNYLHAFRFLGVWEGILEAWTPRPGEEFYRPLVETTYGLTYAVVGAAPLGFRLFDLCLHAGVTLLAARLVLEMTGIRSAAWMTGALLALHPLPGRALFWTSDRYVILGAAFTFLAALHYLRWRRRGGRGALGLALVFHALGLLCKESTAAVPVVVLVLDLFWGPRRRGPVSLLLGVLPFVLLDAAYLAFRICTFGDLGGYHDPVDGTLFLPFGPGRMGEEALLDVPLGCLLPLNRDLLSPAMVALFSAVLIGVQVWLGVAMVRDRDHRARSRIHHGLGGLALGYALLLPSLPYFYLGRDLLKAYHLYPVFLGLGLATWAALGSRKGRLPLGILFVVYACVGQIHVQSWIRATEVVKAFGSWCTDLDPPLDETARVWVAGMPWRWRGALVMEPNQMHRSLEVLLDRRLAAAQGLGAPWCTASNETVRESLDRGGRLLHWNPERLVGRERTREVRGGARGTDGVVVLLARGRGVRGAWDARGEATPCKAPGAWIVEGRKGHLRWQGPALDPGRFRGVEIRMRLTPAVEGPASPVDSANLRWSPHHYSPGGIHRLARFEVKVDGALHLYQVDLVKSGWVGEDAAIDTLTLSPGKGALRVEVDWFALVPW